MLKRIITSLFCLFLIFASMPIWGYSHFLCVSVFADSGSGSVGADWNQVTTNDQMVQSFLAYCKSRDSQIVGGVPNAVANVTYSYMQQLSKTVGIDLNELQSELYYKQESNKPLQWFMTSTGITAYNHLFAQLISEKGFEVGEPAEAVLQSGEYWQDDNGNGCFVVQCGAFNRNETSVATAGTPYRYSGQQLYNLFTITAPNVNQNTTVVSVKNSNTYNIPIRLVSRNTMYMFYDVTVGSGVPTFRDNRGELSVDKGGLVVTRFSDKSNLWFSGQFYEGTVVTPVLEIANSGNSTTNTSVTFISNNIKNVYEGDTYINNEGDIITNNTPGGQDPGWNVGSGQGSYSDGEGNSYTINFPDFELPDLNIDWSISGLGNKFPFSIPFDIVSLVTVLNAEPEAPRFQGTVNFGFTTWDYDINLQQFDTVAQVCRIAELLLLVFGLILITRSIIKG